MSRKKTLFEGVDVSGHEELQINKFFWITQHPSLGGEVCGVITIDELSMKHDRLIYATICRNGLFVKGYRDVVPGEDPFHKKLLTTDRPCKYLANSKHACINQERTGRVRVKFAIGRR